MLLASCYIPVFKMMKHVMHRVNFPHQIKLWLCKKGLLSLVLLMMLLPMLIYVQSDSDLTLEQRQLHLLQIVMKSVKHFILRPFNVLNEVCSLDHGAPVTLECCKEAVMDDNSQRLHVQVFGHVQGVSFRYYTQLRAKELGLTGWVRNRPDGSVEVIAEGNRNRLEDLLAFLHQGSPAADVTNVNVDWLAANGEFSDFRVR